jgi:hypothetical protein
MYKKNVVINTIKSLDGICYEFTLLSINQFLKMYIVINEHSVVVIMDNGVILVDELQLSSEQ